MATQTSTKSGNWSDATVWTTAVPLSGDTVIVSAGNTVTFDVDESGFASGLVSLTITGTLTVSTAAGTYQLKMAGNITGAGTFNIGSSSTPYPTNCQCNILFNGAYTIDCTSGLNCQFWCANPTLIEAQLISSSSKAITGITQANPAVVTCTAHGYANGATVFLANVGGMSQITNQQFKVAGVTSNTFQLQWPVTSIGVDSTGFTAWTSGGSVCPSQAQAAADTVIYVDSDVSGDSAWNSTLGSKLIRIDNVNQAQQSEERTISAITSTTITITAGLTNTKLCGSRLLLMNRNIRVTGSTATVVNNGSKTGNNYGAEFSGMPGIVVITGDNNLARLTFTGTISGSGYGIYQVPFSTFAGVMSGQSNDSVVTCANSVVNSRISGTAYAINNSQNVILAGEVTGAGQVASSCTASVSSRIYGSGAVFYNTMLSSLSGSAINCTYCFYTSLGTLTTPGVIQSCTNPFAYTNAKVFGTVRGCGSANSSGSLECRGAKFEGHASDIVAVANTAYPLITAWNTAFRSASAFANYQIPTNSAYPAMTINYDPVLSNTAYPGRLQGWTPGGKITNNELPPSSPPVALGFTNLFTFQDTAAIAYPVYADIPVFGASGSALTINVYLKKSVNGMEETPRIQLIDPGQGFDTAASKLVDNAMADNTNWQTITISYTPASNKQLILRVRGRHTSGTLDWNYAVASGGSTLIVVED